MQTVKSEPLAAIARRAGVEYQRLWRAQNGGGRLTDDERRRLAQVGVTLHQLPEGVFILEEVEA